MPVEGAPVRSEAAYSWVPTSQTKVVPSSSAGITDAATDSDARGRLLSALARAPAYRIAEALSPLVSMAVGLTCNASAAAPPVVMPMSVAAELKLTMAGLSNEAFIAARSLLVPAGSKGASGAFESLPHPTARAARMVAARTRVADCRTRMKSPPEVGKASARPKPAWDSDLAESVHPSALGTAARPRRRGQWACRTCGPPTASAAQGARLPARPPSRRSALGPWATLLDEALAPPGRLWLRPVRYSRAPGLRRGLGRVRGRGGPRRRGGSGSRRWPSWRSPGSSAPCARRAGPRARRWIGGPAFRRW